MLVAQKTLAYRLFGNNFNNPQRITLGLSPGTTYPGERISVGYSSF